MNRVVLIRGLSTSGADQVKLGSLNFGSFYQGWESALRHRKTDYLTLEHLGTGTLKDSYQVAAEFLRAQIRQHPEIRFHLFTHSSGGLLGRRLTYEPEFQGRILSLVTLACPHRGSHLIELAERWSRRATLRSVFRCLGYDLEERLDHLRELAPEKMVTFNNFYPVLKGVKQINVLSAPAPSERAWMFGLIRGKNVDLSLGDGILTVKEQHWQDAEVWGPFRLDHLSSLGLFWHLRPERRALARREFERLIDQLSSVWQTF